MVRMLAVAGLTLGLVAPAAADVTITSTNTGKGMGKMAGGEGITYIKGTKMRADNTIGGNQFSTIIDVGSQKFIAVDHKKKEAELYDLAALTAEIQKNLQTTSPTVSFKPNGQTKQILGQACTGYDVSISIAMAPGGSGGGMEMTLVMTGPVYIAKGAPGSQDFATFYKTAAEKGFFFTDPRQAKGAPAQTKSLTELYRQMAEAGGVPYSQDIQMKIEGGGPMAGLMKKMMGETTVSYTVTAVSTDPIQDDKFQVPAGYKTKTK